MAQPSEAAVGEAVTTDSTTPAIEASTTPKDAIDAIVDDWLPEEEQEAGEAEPQGEAEPEDETEAEPEAPAIEPPVSWTAEEKEAFKALPKDVQDVVSRRESEREKFVQTKAQEATRAKQEAERVAFAQVAEIERQAVEQLQQLSASLLPQEPDPALLRGTDEHRAYYYEQKAIFEQAVAQQQLLQHAAAQGGQQLNAYQQELQRREADDFRQTLATNFPEYLEPSNAKLREDLGSIALELGYSQEQIQQARAPDIIAMKKVLELKDKASKYDALMSKKMETVRSAKNLPPVAKPGTATTPSQQSAAKRQTAWNRVKSDRTDYGAFADYLEASGTKL